MSMFLKPRVLVRSILLGMLAAGPIFPLLAWSDEDTKVGIDNFKFAPNPLTISKGSAVTWTNHDDIPHSIVLNALGVHSKAMDTDGAFTYTFDKTGTFFYVCGLHPFMQAKVVVK
jgi:plastocyanin